jgi:4-amino-4-deoxy-L-arabinose transferase-like glycosyltransferase
MRLGIIFLLLPFTALSFFHAIFFPELYADALIYAEWARIIFKEKSLAVIEGGPSLALGLASNYPSAFQLLGAFTYFFTGENITNLKILSAISFLLLALLVYKWSKEVFHSSHFSLLSLILLFSLPAAATFSRTSSHYMFLALQFALAAYFLYKFDKEQKGKFLFCSAVFGSVAASTSYLGLLYLPLLLLSAKFEKKNYKKILLSLAIFFCLSSWYLRNLVLLANPIWPFGGGNMIDPVIYANTLQQINEVSKSSGFNYESLPALFNSLYRLLYPFNAFAIENYILQPVLTLLALPGLAVYFKKRDAEMNFFLKWFLLILLFFIFVFNTWQKYLILISVPTVCLAVYFVKQMSKKLKWFFAVAFAAFTIFSLFLNFSLVPCSRGKSTIYNYLNAFDRNEMLEVCYGNSAKIWKWVNENVPEGKLVATYEPYFYYYNKTVVAFDSWQLRQIYHTANDTEIIAVLKSNNIAFLVVLDTEAKLKKYSEQFALLYETEGIKIYKME